MAVTQSTEVKRLLREAKELAIAHGVPMVTTGHLLEAMLTDTNTRVASFFNKINIHRDEMLHILHDFYPNESDKKSELSNRFEECILIATEQAKELGSKEVTTLHLLLALFMQEKTVAQLVLCSEHPRVEWMQYLIRELNIKAEQWLSRHPHVVTPKEGELLKTSDEQLVFTAEKFPTLYPVGRNLVEKAKRGEIDPVIGRDDEIERTLQILGRRTKNNPMLLGDPGVGKTAVAEGVALQIASGQVPQEFKHKLLIQLDIAGVVAGTKFRGEFEEKMKKIIDEVRRHGNIILFIDEMHMLMNAGGSEGAVDASNILKPALARGEIQVMGATTYDEYQKHVEKDRAFERRFAPVKIDEPTLEETQLILEGLRQHYEQYHHLTIDEEALLSATRLANRYLPDRHMPDKAIDLVDEACAKVKLAQKAPRRSRQLKEKYDQLEENKCLALKDNHFVEACHIEEEQKKVQAQLEQSTRRSQQQMVTKHDIEAVLSQWTGIPVQQMAQKESERLMHLESTLEKEVIGQSKACEAIAKAVRRARSGLKDPNRPIGSFMFLGPTGVGKTELAKTLAKTMFGSEENMIRVDMSEFMSKENVSRLIGSAPGYVGYDEGGQLTEKVRHQPYSVVLFDEVEKAHPEVFNIMLQMLDDGFVTDAKGRRVDFKNTIIIMTSNLGATELRDNKQVGFGAKGNFDQNAMAQAMQEALRQHFRPEFINRIDETIIFNPLQKEDMIDIAKLMIQDIKERLLIKDISLKVTRPAIEILANEGYDEENGARPLKRVIQNEVENRIADALLSSQLVSGQTARLGAKQGELYLDII